MAQWVIDASQAETKMPEPIDRRAIAPAFAAMICGGSSLVWILWRNGLPIFQEWYVYPSIIAFIALGTIGLYVFCGLSCKVSHILWRLVMWWSGVWTVLFLLAFIAPPFSTMIVAGIAEPITKSAGVHPFIAGAVHLMVCACAIDILKVLRRNSTTA